MPVSHRARASIADLLRLVNRNFYICKRPGGQAVKTPPFHGDNTGSSPVRVTTFFQPFSPHGGIAQPVERPPHTRKVTDSSSVVSTILSPEIARFQDFFFFLLNIFLNFPKMSNGFLTGRFFLRFRGCQCRLNGVCHVPFGGVKKVGIDVDRGGNVAMSKPSLNVLDIPPCAVE